jgi:hypothetical protein
MENLENLETVNETSGENVEEISEAKAEETEKTKEEKLFTQADLDAAIEKRLQREKRKAEKEAAKMAEEAKAKDDSEEIKALKELLKAKDQRIIKHESEKVAKEMGIENDFIEAALALADFSEVELDNNGGVDAEELKEALKAVIDKYPKFLAAKKEETTKGFIKAGVEQKNSTAVDKIEAQIRKAMGL